MSKKMLVNATHHEENRVAIVEDGILVDLDIEIAGHEPTKGNIYRAVVVRVESGLQAAFVDYGAGRLGFLQIDEINYSVVNPDYQSQENSPRPKITDLLQRGQEILVQIIKEERGTKGAALTTYLSLAGRYMVIMPGSQTKGVSRKAESDSQRKELKQAMASIDMIENIGYIVRTAALNQTREELERDYRYLIRLYESIKELDRKVKAPALLYKESNLIIRSIRDYFTTDMDEVLIDDLQVFNEAKEFFQMVMPDHAKLVKLHQERRPIFSRYQIEEQIETINRNNVSLPSGGSIVIDPTEALVAIDVNSGKMSSEQGVEATATKTNLEAAKEIGRQLRLRDLGGLVVIDFIDMRERKHMREVEKELKTSMQNDKAKVNIGRISQFGLLEMSRQRLKASLASGSYLTCPHCLGAGRLKSPETQAVSLLRKIHASAAKGLVSRIDAQLPMDVAAYLLNYKREELITMERDHHLQIHIHGNRDFLADQLEIDIQKKEKDKLPQPEFVAAGLLPAPSDDHSQERTDKTTQEEVPDNISDLTKKRRRRKRQKPSEVAIEGATSTDLDVPDQKTTGQEIQTPPQQEETSPGGSAPETSSKKARRGRPKTTKSKVAEQNKTNSDKTTGEKDQGFETENLLSSEKDKVSEAKPVKGRPRRGTNKKGPSRPSSSNQKDLAKEQDKGPEVIATEGANMSVEQPSASRGETAQTTRKRRSPRRPKPEIERPVLSDNLPEHMQQKESTSEEKTPESMKTQPPKDQQRKPRERKTSGNRVRSKASKQNSPLPPENSEGSTNKPEATVAPKEMPIQRKQVESEISETE